VLGESKKYNEALTGQNEELSRVVEKAAKLTVLNTRGSAFKLKSSGKEVSTDKASRADVLRISYNCRKSSCTIRDKIILRSGYR
jgi:hypothetical protein